MLGAIAGDIAGSVFEADPIKTKTFPLFSNASTFTDDTVLIAAIAHAILKSDDYSAQLRNIGRRYPGCGYGGAFIEWLFSDTYGPYNSWGNGSAMRVSPVGFAFSTRETVCGSGMRPIHLAIAVRITTRMIERGRYCQPGRRPSRLGDYIKVFKNRPKTYQKNRHYPNKTVIAPKCGLLLVMFTGQAIGI